MSRENKLVGFQCTRRCPRISHLFIADDSILFTRANDSDCASLLEILKVYEKASGQMVNLEKSCITFSPNTNKHNKRQILAQFGIDSSKAHDKYLGLPTVVGEIRVFGDIKYKVWKHISGWRKGIFSVGGKEILIKAVLQAVLSYLTSIF